MTKSASDQTIFSIAPFGAFLASTLLRLRLTSMDYSIAGQTLPGMPTPTKAHKFML